MKEKIAKKIAEAIREFQTDGVWEHCTVPDIILQHPQNTNFGDYATSVAFTLARELKKSPSDIARALAKKLSIPEMESIVAVEPGYINFSLTKNVLGKIVGNILAKKEKYGRNENLSGQKIMVEYTQPNPFKPFHIGHLMSNAIGETMANLLAFSGAEVKRANYQGDIGLHVAKTLWGLCQKDANPKNIDALGKAYAYGHEQYETNDDAKMEMMEMNRKLYGRSDEKLLRLYKQGRETSLAHFEEIYKTVGTVFDYYFFESEVQEQGKKIVQENIGKVFEESDGAIIFDGEKHGLHKRVFITSEGLPTYETKEVGLVFAKKKKYSFDRSITVTAVEQKEYFNVVFAVIGMLDADLKEKMEHLSHGMLRLSSGKMSSRKGNVITGESLLSLAIAFAKEKIQLKDVSDEEQKEIALDVGVSALKFEILKQSLDKDIIYDAEQSFSLEGNSGPYLQYAFARTQSLQKKAKEEGIMGKTEDIVLTDAEMMLGRILHQFPTVVENATNRHAPQIICTYLLDLAQAFNAYYAQTKIVDAEDEQSQSRIAVVGAIGNVLKNGLALLGIRAPERM